MRRQVPAKAAKAIVAAATGIAVAIAVIARNAATRRQEPSAAAHGGMPIAPESAPPALETMSPSPMEVPLPVIAPPPVAPAPPQAVFEPPRTIDPSEVETVINVAVARTQEPEILMPPKPAQPQPRPVAALPPVSMALPADSGLELVETRSKATLMPEPEPAPAAGPRRVRPPRPVIAEEPLQIIETRKENSPPAG